MIYGTFRDGHPRLSLELPGRTGPIKVEFIVDTGFEGDLILPREVLRQLLTEPSGYTSQSLAGGRIDKFETEEMESNGRTRRERSRLSLRVGSRCSALRCLLICCCRPK
jgi:predicted aspartyl protease